MTIEQARKILKLPDSVPDSKVENLLQITRELVRLYLIIKK